MYKFHTFKISSYLVFTN